MMVSTHRDKARVGTITSHMEHFLEWKDPYPLTREQVGSEASSQEVLIAGLFTRKNFLDIVQNFTVFEPVDGRIIKKIPRYQQFRAVHKTIERIKTGKDRKEKSGVIWHTQGSGKSLTMVFLTLKIRRDPELRDYKLVFLTDRTQLDNQLTTTFRNAQGETVRHADSVKNLKNSSLQILRTSLRQWFRSFRKMWMNLSFPFLMNQKKSSFWRMKRTELNTARWARRLIPRSLTHLVSRLREPLSSGLRRPLSTFGSYIDTYTIEEAVKDGATVQILYEGREPAVKVTGDSLDSLFDEYFEDRTSEEKEAIKKKFGTDKAVWKRLNVFAECVWI